MLAALSLIVILTVSMMVVRAAAVALRHTGLPDNVAQFQCLSAFTGAGFTTTETEQIVNYPVRRRIISWLMLTGNLGLASVVAAVVVSLAGTDGAAERVVVQIGWLLAAIALLWVVMLNPRTDRVLCSLVGRILRATTQLGTRSYVRTLQVADGYSVVEHTYRGAAETTLETIVPNEALTCIAVHHADGTVDPKPTRQTVIRSRDVFVLYGPDENHETVENNANGRTQI